MFTRQGKSVAALGLALVVGGVLIGNPPLIVFGLAALLVLGVAGLWILSRPRLSADREVRPPRVTEGQPATGLLTVTNLARRRSPAMLVMEAFGDSSIQVPIPSLEPEGTHTKPYKLPTDRRGVFRVGPLLVSRSDPFGLMRLGQPQRTVETLVVHPRTLDVTPFPSGQARDLEGPTSGEAPVGGVAFHTLREYVRGDDLRLVHWRSSARTGTLMVRHNVDTNQPRSLLILDTRREVYTQDGFEEAVRSAASVVVASTTNNFPIRLRTTCGKVIGSERGGRADAILDQLAGLGLSDDASLAAFGKHVAYERGGMSLAVITGQSTARELVVIGPVRSRFDTITIARLGVGGVGSVHELPGGILINAETAEDFAQAWNRRITR